MENIDTQIAKIVFHKMLAIMKFTLNLEEYSYREKGREDPRYKLFKQQLMQYTYDTARETLKEMQKTGIITPTETPEDVKNGYASGPSGGSGFVNSKELDSLIDKLAKD